MSAPLIAQRPASASLAGREHVVALLAGSVIAGGELAVVSAAETALAAALADAAARVMADERGYATVRADARLVADEADLARTIARGTVATLGDLRALEPDAYEDPQLLAIRLRLARQLGEPMLALAAGTLAVPPTGIDAIVIAGRGVVAASEALSRKLVFVLHGVDELARPGRSRFADGPDTLWKLRGALQAPTGPVILTGGVGAARMAADERQAFYAHGQLYEVGDLSADKLAQATRALLGGALDDGALLRAGQLIGQALWVADALRPYLADDRRADIGELEAAWQALVESRAAAHLELLRALAHVNRHAVGVLKAIARGERPYARRSEARAQAVFRALAALEANATIQRQDAGWRLADPTLASMLATAD